MSTILILCFAAFANAEDFTGTPFHWPDMLRSGGRVVQILTDKSTPRPAAWNYPTWYSKYPMRFVEDIPIPPGGEVAGAELVVLEYDISDKMGHGMQELKDQSEQYGAAGKAWMEALSPKHNELGLIAKDKSGNEVGRFVFSLWPIGNDEVKDLNRDMRQRPRELMVNNVSTLAVKNRAVTSIELSKAYTWWGLPKDTKMIHVSNLNKQGFYRTLQAVKDFAKNHPYFNDFEVTDPDGTVKMPAVTCNSLIEYVTQIGSNQDAFKDGLAKMGYLQLNVKQSKKSSFKSYDTKYVRDLMRNRKLFNAHFNKDLFIIPAYYNQKGQMLEKGCKEDPEKWHVIWSAGDKTWRQNYAKAQTFQLRTVVKQGTAMGNGDKNGNELSQAYVPAGMPAAAPKPAVKTELQQKPAVAQAGKKLDLKVKKEQDDGEKHDWIWKLKQEKKQSEGKNAQHQEENGKKNMLKNKKHPQFVNPSHAMKMRNAVVDARRGTGSAMLNAGKGAANAIPRNLGQQLGQQAKKALGNFHLA